MSKCSMQKKIESLNEDSAIAISDIKAALNEVANEVKPNVDEVRVEDNKDFMGPGAMATIFIDDEGDAIWWFSVKTADNSIEVSDDANEDHDYGKFSNIEELKSIFKKFLQEDIPSNPDDDDDDSLDDDIKTMVRELAKETGNNYKDAEVDEFRVPGRGTSVTFGSEEYYCYADYDDAEEAAQESVKDMLDSEGVSFINFDNIGGIEQYVDTDWFDDAKRESAESYVYDIKESDPERYEEEFGDLDEDDAVEKFLDEYCESDSIEWYINNFGKSEFDDVVTKYNLVDLDELAKDCVDADGPSHELASYDGEEIELPCGYYCYRHN